MSCLEEYLGPFQISTMELFCENEMLKKASYFYPDFCKIYIYINFTSNLDLNEKFIKKLESFLLLKIYEWDLEFL